MYNYPTYEPIIIDPEIPNFAEPELTNAISGFAVFCIIALIIALVVRILFSIFIAGKLRDAAERKDIHKGIYGWAIILGILFGFSGLALMALVVCAYPERNDDDV